MWIPNGNQTNTNLINQVETVKWSIDITEAHILRCREDLAEATQEIKNLKNSIDYLKYFAIIINAREYKRMRHYLAGRLGDEIVIRQRLAANERSKEILERDLQLLNRKLAANSFKLLEMKPRGK